jgi:hypothetical protein
MFPLRHGLVVFVFLVMHASVSAAAPCADGVRLNGEAIEFSGILHHEERWGPPNFGENPETDSKFTAWIVSVGTPIPVQGGAEFDGKTLHAISEIQIIVPPFTFRQVLQSLDGKMVVVTGELWNATVQGDVRPVNVMVKTLKPTGQTICRVKRGN